MKVVRKGKVDSIEKLAQLVAEGFVGVEERFDGVDERFDKLDAELAEIKKILNRIDTRVAALELAVFGASAGDGKRFAAESLLDRVSRLEHTVFKK